jgi:hypothetical protein
VRESAAEPNPHESPATIVENRNVRGVVADVARAARRGRRVIPPPSHGACAAAALAAAGCDYFQPGNGYTAFFSAALAG